MISLVAIARTEYGIKIEMYHMHARKKCFRFSIRSTRGSGWPNSDHEAGRRRGGRMRTAKKSDLGYIAQHIFTYIVNLSVELCYVVAESHFCYL